MTKVLIIILVGVMLLLSFNSCSSSEEFSFGFKKRGSEPVAKPGEQILFLKSGKQKRRYILYLPPGISNGKPLPIVFVFHGGGGNAESARDMSLFNQKADKEGVIMVYPSGTSGFLFRNKFQTWNAGDCCGKAVEKNIDDVGFIRDLIDKLQSSLPVDAKRIYATGMSNGGSMTYRLACELSDRIAAIAAVSASPNFNSCEPSHPISVMIFHGTADRYVPYQGGIGRKAFNKTRKKPISYAFNYWIQKNKIPPKPLVEEKGKILKQYAVSQDGKHEVVFYTIKGGDHAWPGGTKAGWEKGPEPSRDISATDVMWEFFARHSRD